MTQIVDKELTTLHPELWRRRPGGHDIDVLVAEHVYSWRKVRPDRRTALPVNATCTAFSLEWEHERTYPDGQSYVDNVGCVCHYTPRFSTDPAASKELAEFLRKSGWLLVTKQIPDGLSFILGNDAVTDPHVREPYYAELKYQGHHTKKISDWTERDYTARYLQAGAFSGASVEMAVACAALEMAYRLRGYGLGVR